VGVGALVGVTLRGRRAELAEDDDAGGAAIRVQTSSSIVKITWSLGSRPGCSVPIDSSMASGVTMWMHFHGQMSTQPSHMMHSDWSMWMNCLGLTTWLSQAASTSCRT
jgi:hypothetical protein